MNLLAIDTSTDLATVALSFENEILSAEKAGTREHAQVLLTLIDSLLNSASIRLNQLDGIVFGRGPGSFTGLRICCSVAKALAYAYDLPLFPVSSLASIAAEAFAIDSSHNVSHVLAVIDARMQELYWGSYSKGLYDVEETVSSPVEINIPKKGPILLAGVGFESYTHLLSESIHSQIIDSHVIYPHAKTMLRLVKAGGIASVTSEKAQPLYVRNQVTQGVTRG